MTEGMLGKNPLEGELDSIWKVPQGGAQAAPAAAPAAAQTSSGEEWSPLDGVGGPVGEDEIAAVVGMPGTSEYEEHLSPVEDTVQMVGFRIETEMFGIDIMKVQEIIKVQEVTRVPRTERFIRGVVNLRGKVIPVISLRERFAFPPPEEGLTEAKIMIVNTDVGTVGFEVDTVTEVFRIAKSAITPPPPTATRLEAEYLSGVGRLNGRLLVVLNLDRLLTRREGEAA